MGGGGREGNGGWFETLGGGEKHVGEFGVDWSTGRGRWGGGSRVKSMPVVLFPKMATSVWERNL